MRKFVDLTILFLTMLSVCGFVLPQYGYNHPELKWYTIETEHFLVHYHNGAEWTAKRVAEIAEKIYKPVTEFYGYEPDSKTQLIIKDTDDYSNGAAYYYDNKILIWATPLDFILRGSHNWLWDVVTHEFTHIVSLQSSMKFSRKIPGMYFQVYSYEDEKRDDVLYGYPYVMAIYPFPGVVIPMWLAEGVAQYMYRGCPNDFWDSHRDMILRDRVLNDRLLSFEDMNHFGYSGIGNESVYNQGFALTSYIVDKYGDDVPGKVFKRMKEIKNLTINRAFKEVTGKTGFEIYNEWKNFITKRYRSLTQTIKQNEVKGKTIVKDGATSQIFPHWVGDSLIFFLSNKGQDYISQTSLYVFNRKTNRTRLVLKGVRSRITCSRDGRIIYFTKKSKPNKYGSIYYDIYSYDLENRKEKQITKWRRAYNPSLSPDGKFLAFVTGKDGTSSLVVLNLEDMSERQITEFNNGEQLFTAVWSPDGKKLAFDCLLDHGRDIYIYDMKSGELRLLLGEKCDTRDPYFSPDGRWLYFSSDETGIFNIYCVSLIDGHRELVTNVVGGAFSPSVNAKGELVYSLFEGSSFKIAMIENCRPIDEKLAEYYDYESMIPRLSSVKDKDFVSRPYQTQYSIFFFLPTLMIDYGTLKPGIYFFSSEMLEKMSLSGGFTVNRLLDRDLALILEVRKWKPTLYMEFYNLRRKVSRSLKIYESYPARTKYKFELIELDVGVSHPLGVIAGVDFRAVYSKYRATVQEWIPAQNIYTNPFSYNYYRGVDFILTWKYHKLVPVINSESNPEEGLNLRLEVSRNYDHFLKDFGIYEDYATLREIYKKNYYWKIYMNGVIYKRLVPAKKITSSLRWQAGWISKYDVDSFFYFFAGSLPGLRGYPYYSIEGRNLFSVHYTIKAPIFREKSISLPTFCLSNAFIGIYFEAGNAWNGIEGKRKVGIKEFLKDSYGVTKRWIKDFKKDAGVELILSGFSFYSYPLSLTFDFAYGFDRVEWTNGDRRNEYGKKLRFYFTMSFGI